MELDNLHYLLAAIAIGMGIYISKEASKSLVLAETKVKNNKLKRDNTKNLKSKKKKEKESEEEEEECPTNYPLISGAVISGSSTSCIVLIILLVFAAIHLKVPALITQLGQVAQLVV